MRAAYHRLSGAVGVALAKYTDNPGLGLEIVRRAYGETELLATGDSVTDIHGHGHSAPMESECHDPPHTWDAIPG